jgi:predicted RNA-binding protein with PUA-like domain
MAYWILKTEPSAYSYDQLEKERHAVWDGVSNPVALKNLRAMVEGDDVMVYHTGDEKAVVGLARVTKAAYPDPKRGDPRLVVVEIEAIRRLPQPVPLAAIRADKTFAAVALVRQPRLSVSAVDEKQWQRLRELAGG